MNSGEPGYSRTKSMQQQALTSKELSRFIGIPTLSGQMVFWQSDQRIVSLKSQKGDGEKALTRKRWGSRDTSSVLRDGAKMSTKLLLLTCRARRNPKEKFTSLMHLFTKDFLLECFWELKRDKASGVDGVRVEEYEGNLEENIQELAAKMKGWKYQPKPARRVYLPKPNGEKRPLGIPTVEDKIVQMGVKKILEAIFEANFLDVSYGFRPNRNCHAALEALDKSVMTKPVSYVVDMDIEKFFDAIDHLWLRECLRQRIADLNFLRLIGRFLRAGVMEDGKFIEIEKGTPQGAVLSPILANIYLHFILDLWFKKVTPKECKGFAQLIRYADDFVVCFQKGSEAKAFRDMLRQRLAKFGLRIAEDKSRIIEFGRYPWQKAQKEGRKLATFDFLGFTHYCTKTRKGKFRLGRKTARVKFAQKAKAMNQWLKDIRNLVKLKEWWQVLGQKLIGHYNYYGISGNMQGLQKFYRMTFWLAYKWINRRSQKKSHNLERFYRFAQYNPLPQPRIYHRTYTLSSC